jgi:hypothetical protein
VDFISKHAAEIWSFVAGAVGGSLLTLKITRYTAGRDVHSVSQSHARAGGDIVGRDKRVDQDSRKQ